MVHAVVCLKTTKHHMKYEEYLRVREDALWPFVQRPDNFFLDVFSDQGAVEL